MSDKNTGALEESEKVCKERGQIYGDPSEMSRKVAMHWSAILQTYFPDHDIPNIPPHLVGLMMAALKIHRASTPYEKKDADSYIDLHNYVEFSRNIDPHIPNDYMNWQNVRVLKSIGADADLGDAGAADIIIQHAEKYGVDHDSYETWAEVVEAINKAPNR